jgi:hypothetical protein
LLVGVYTVAVLGGSRVGYFLFFNKRRIHPSRAEYSIRHLARLMDEFELELAQGFLPGEPSL